VDRNIVYYSKWCAGAGGENASWDTSAFNIQVSSDDANWTTVVNVTGNTSDITTNTISSTQARYIHLNITNTQASTSAVAARIYELEVFSS
jgi:hypothetical protein